MPVICWQIILKPAVWNKRKSALLKGYTVKDSFTIYKKTYRPLIFRRAISFYML